MLNHVLKKLKGERPIVSIDMREHSFRDVNSFLSSMEGKFREWHKAMKESAIGFRIGAGLPEVGHFETEMKLSTIYDNETAPSKKLEKLYGFFVKNLPDYSLWSGKRIPILFIDEANEMANLPKSGEEGAGALRDLLNFFVKCTKQDRKFSVILASSDSFYPLWLSRYIGSKRFNTYVIGDLGKEEAQRYWEEHVTQFSEVPPSLFEEAYSVCGGNMLTLENYAYDYANDPKFTPLKFSAVIQSEAHLMRGLHAKPAVWDKKTLLLVMKELCESENGWILYNPLCDEIGRKIVDAMIESNLMHLRPAAKFSFDVKNAPNKPILTAESPVAAFAMKLILDQYQ